MDRERLKRVRRAMEEAGLEALVLRLPENVVWLSGHWPLCGWSFLYFPLEGRPFCLVPHCEEREARDELWEAECLTFPFGVLEAGDPYAEIARLLGRVVGGRRPRRVGYEGCFESVAPAWNTAESAVPARLTRALLEKVFGEDILCDVADFIHGERAVKTDVEVANLRRVNEIARIGLKVFAEAADVGMSGVELAARVEQAIMSEGTGHNGARRVRAFAQVSTGAAETARAYRPMVLTTTRRLAPGELALLELGVVVDGFWADRTRVRVAGSPSEEQRDVFEVVLRAQKAAIAAIRPGVTVGEVDEAARAIVREAGHEEAFPHVTGHGVGLRYHEPVPLIVPGGTLLLRKGMVHTVEPGIYLNRMGGIRLEDNVVVTPEGAEELGGFEKEMER